jgi:hypothetical protein
VRVAELADIEPQIVSAAAAISPPAEATLVLDASSSVISFASEGSWVPVMVLDEAADLTDVLSNPSALRLLFDHPGTAFVVEKGGTSGYYCISGRRLRDACLEFLRSDAAMATTLLGPDYMLPDIAQPPQSLIKVRCSVCQTVNELEEYPPLSMRMCVGGGHAFEGRWD